MSYHVTIRKEKSEYVARDDNGDWRTRGPASICDGHTGRDLAKLLFHECEIGEVSTDESGNTRVLILK